MNEAPAFGDERLPATFWAKVNVNSDGCWEWVAARVVSGYGVFLHRGITRRAHRLAYIELVGPVPSELVCDHLCRNRACVNPAHLEPVTCAENLRRADIGTIVRQGAVKRRAERTHCRHGHPVSVMKLDNRGALYCTVCYRNRRRKPKTVGASA